MKRCYTLILLSALLSTESAATRRYVNAAAAGANNGTSWANAFTTLQAGIGAATSGDTIWVANGIYKPTTTGNRNASFIVPGNTVIYGGFTGTETALSQRNYSTWQTVLSGDIGQTGIHTDNVYHVVTANAVSSSTRLDGFKIVHGRAENGFSYGGGGLYGIDGSPTVANCYFTENYGDDGGAVFLVNADTVHFLGCIFTDNTAFGFGGAINLVHTALPVTGVIGNFQDCDISANQAAFGAACFFSDGVITMDRCLLSGNSAGFEAGVFYSGANLTCSNTLIIGNTATNEAVSHQGANVTNPTRFVNCTIAHNKNTNLFGFNQLIDFKTSPSNLLQNSIVWGNVATSLSGSTPVITNTVLQPEYHSKGPGSDTLNPQFVAPAQAAMAPFTLGSFDYHLNAISHAIDTGNNSHLPPLSVLDLSGNTRTQNGRVDLGAYEHNSCTFTPAMAPAAPSKFCAGDSLTLTLSGGTRYRWFDGDTTNYSTIKSPGWYLVTAVDAAGCRAAIRWEADTFPLPYPAVVHSAGILQTGSFTTFQWQLNGTDIPGATSQTYSPTVNGSYTVRVTNASGCEGTSAPVTINNVGIAETAAREGLRVFPNPAVRELFVAMNGEAAGIQVTLANSLGQQVQQWQIPAAKAYNPVRLPLEAHAPGLYFLRISSGGTTRMRLLRVTGE